MENNVYDDVTYSTSVYVNVFDVTLFNFFVYVHVCDVTYLIYDSFDCDM